MSNQTLSAPDQFRIHVEEVIESAERFFEVLGDDPGSMYTEGYVAGLKLMIAFLKDF